MHPHLHSASSLTAPSLSPCVSGFSFSQPVCQGWTRPLNRLNGCKSVSQCFPLFPCMQSCWGPCIRGPQGSEFAGPTSQTVNAQKQVVCRARTVCSYCRPHRVHFAPCTPPEIVPVIQTYNWATSALRATGSIPHMINFTYQPAVEMQRLQLRCLTRTAPAAREAHLAGGSRRGLVAENFSRPGYAHTAASAFVCCCCVFTV